MAVSNPNPIETGIKLASSLVPEIQCIILKFVIEDFVCFIEGITEAFSDHTITSCSNNVQAQLLSLTGYDDLLDDIICMAINELDLTLNLFDYKRQHKHAPFIDEFINFVTSRSVKLKRVNVWTDFDSSVEQLTNPNTMKLLESHSDGVRLMFFAHKIPTNCFYFNFVNILDCSLNEFSELLTWGSNKLTSLTKFSVRLFDMRELSRLEKAMKHLPPSVKKLYVHYSDFAGSEESYVDFLSQASTFITKHSHLSIQFDIFFTRIQIKTNWRLDSKKQIPLPLLLPTTYPKNINEVDKIAQWCSVPDQLTHMFQL
ncbi:unnamed protein product [Ambrosiozyma monospora]|uniref:Unnamed protein product n=1 Tax=Ambrosiozyma monospora TaxID=43982 RepID=A0ACB5SSL3_AMBMO|nr:unnamed protein product [Ambrosiozyma monospora]